MTRNVRSLAWVALAVTSLAVRLTAQTQDDTVQVGDRVLLHVEGEPQLSDTFTVTPGPALVLPAIGELTLKDVRRAQVEPYLTRALARYLKTAIVRARVLVRLSVLGEVEHPGFYAVPADAVLTQAIMAAGGPTREANYAQMRIERDQVPVWSGEALQQSITRGLTVDQMKLRSGDLIVVPRRHSAAVTAQVLGVLIMIPATIYGLTRVH